MYAIQYTRATGETGVFATRYKSEAEAARMIRQTDARVMSGYKLEVIKIGNSAK